MTPHAIIKAKSHSEYWAKWMEDAPNVFQIDVMTRFMSEKELRAFAEKYTQYKASKRKKLQDQLLEVTEDDLRVLEAWENWTGSGAEFMRVYQFDATTRFAAFITKVSRLRSLKTKPS